MSLCMMSHSVISQTFLSFWDSHIRVTWLSHPEYAQKMMLHHDHDDSWSWFMNVMMHCCKIIKMYLCAIWIQHCNYAPPRPAVWVFSLLNSSLLAEVEQLVNVKLSLENLPIRRSTNRPSSLIVSTLLIKLIQALALHKFGPFLSRMAADSHSLCKSRLKGPKG